VVNDIREQFGDNIEILRGPLTRQSLRIQTIVLRDQAERLAWLAENIPHLPGTGIIYCLTIADCGRVAAGCNHVALMFMHITPNWKMKKEKIENNG
jgi:ATP-dependent DNA helicase RecQ